MEFYVYAHLIGLEVFYIGKGRKKRCYDLIGRSPYYRTERRDAPVDVRIIGRFDDESKALDLERMLIALYLPRGNRRLGYDDPYADRRKLRKFVIWCEDLQRSFRNFSEASAITRIPRDEIRSCCDSFVHDRRVRGLRFVRRIIDDR